MALIDLAFQLHIRKITPRKPPPHLVYPGGLPGTSSYIGGISSSQLITPIPPLSVTNASLNCILSVPLADPRG